MEETNLTNEAESIDSEVSELLNSEGFEGSEEYITILTEISDSLYEVHNMQMVNASFIGILIGVVLASIFAKYLKH